MNQSQGQFGTFSGVFRAKFIKFKLMRKREGMSDESAKKVKTQHSKIKYWKTTVI